MPLFGRKRATSNPRPSTTSTSAAATTAASQAFLANRASNANLSSSAAAAALRSHTTSPVPVGQIQTKRMQRRGSITSQTSAPSGTTTRPGALQRRDSGGSMTERTFREPSPNRAPDRPASSHGPYPRHDDEDAPPVPALPKNISQISGKRPASIEPPQRISSPTIRQPAGRGLSLDRGPGVITPPPRAVKGKKGLDNVGELERVGSRASVNFSRPMSPQNSPPASPIAGGRVRSPLPTQTGPAPGLANGEAERITHPIQGTAERPVKKKKKSVAKGSAEGSHLAAGTSGSPSHRSEIDATPQTKAPAIISEGPSPMTDFKVEDVSEPPMPKKKKKKKKAPPSAEIQHRAAGDAFGGAYPSDTDSVTSERSSTTDRLRPYNTRAAGLLAKQPSIVREDREAEERADRKPQVMKTERPASTNGATVTSTSANTSKVVSKDRQHTRSASQQTPTSAPKLDVPSAGRPVSLSPARAAHFSAQPINEGAKHQPPARSVSPAKSALKNSPSRGHSPVVTRRGLAPSEASDTASQVSDDGSRSSTTKKKKARVSFDDGSVVVGRAASPPITPDSPVIMSPQTKSLKARTWIDLVRENKSDTIDSDGDEDSSIKPTPKLPSFGSIREREQKPLSSVSGQAPAIEEGTPNTWQITDTSTDLVVGRVIAEDAAAKKAKEQPQPSAHQSAENPLPPQVTSVEGSGYHSDEEDIFLGAEKAVPSQAEVPTIKSEGAINDTVESSKLAPNESKSLLQSSTAVPSIAVEPATPGTGEALANRGSWLGMPGGFPSAKDVESESISKLHTEHQSPVVTPATVGIAEPEPEGEAAQHHPDLPAVGQVAQGLRTQIDGHSVDESEDTDGDSVYSDAAEDQTDTEGDGFGSINAIVESPTTPNMVIKARSPPASPGQKAPKEKSARPGPGMRMDSEASEPPLEEGWDRAQAYWSGLSETRKQQLEQAALPGAIDEPVIRNRSMRGADALQKKKKKKVKQTPQPLGSSDASRPASTQPPVLKSSMRASSPQEDSAPHMRSSMRVAPAKSASKSGNKRSSLNPAPEPKVVLQKKARPVSAVAMIDDNGTEHKALPSRARAVSAGGTATSQAPMAAPKNGIAAVQPKIQRANSDSDSSFKRARAKTPDNGRYTMRRSMRGQLLDAPPNRASSTVARTSSPADATARRPFSSVGPNGTGSMRTSMRGSMDSSKPAARTSLRNSMESSKTSRTKSPSRFSFIGSSKAKPAESKPASRFSSRFGDSSDEDGLPTMTSSRFADSSDEDEPAALAAVRGIPRRVNEGDSTDLEDSSVENAQAPSKVKVNGTQAPAVTSPEGAALATGSLRTPSGGQPPTAAMGTGLQAKKAAEKEKKKRSFFGSLGSRKRDDSSRVQKSDLESPARRDTPLERTKAERMNRIAPETPKPATRILGPSSLMADAAASPRVDTSVGQGSQTSTAQNSPKSPKLQRRNTPKRITSTNDISWPLPQVPADATSTPESSRPRTSDGAPVASNGVTRPSLILRGQSEINGVSGSVAAAKKKRFPMLRKAFGLHD